MPRFRFEAVGSAGNSQVNQIEAENADAAMRQLRAKGLFVTKVTEVTNCTEAKPSHGPEFVAARKVAKDASFDDELPPGSRLQCRLSGQQLVLEIPPCSGMSVSFVGSLPLFYLGGLVVFTLAAVFFALRDGEFWPFIPLGLLWPIGLGLFYLWLWGRFGKTHVLIEPGHLVTQFELFGRQWMREYSLHENSCASLAADFWLEGGGGDRPMVSRGESIRRYGILGRPVYHVHVTTTGRPAKFGSYLSQEEKSWVVARINRHLGH